MTKGKPFGSRFRKEVVKRLIRDLTTQFEKEGIVLIQQSEIRPKKNY